MTIGIGIILGLVVIVLVGYPLYKSKAKAIPGDEQRRKLQSERDTLHVRIHELEIDFERGSTTEEVYRELRHKYEQQLGALTEFPGTHQERPVVTDKEMEDEIERQIRELRQSHSRAHDNVVGSICSSCGAPYNPGDKSCPGCGASLPS